jgi:hypothetical protein
MARAQIRENAKRVKKWLASQLFSPRAPPSIFGDKTQRGKNNLERRKFL